MKLPSKHKGTQITDDELFEKPVIKKRKSVMTGEKATKARLTHFKKKTLPKIGDLIDAAKVERENLEVIQKERVKVEEKLKERQRLLDSAPSAKDQAKLIAGLFKDMKFEPIAEAIKLVKGRALDPKTKAQLILKLAEWTTPKPKMIDTQKDESMNLDIAVVDFSNVTQNDLKNQVEQADDAEYEQFTLKDDEK